ncbi:MAG: polysaccharide deacetylase family protein [Pseudomonadota bacterium]
MSPKRFDQVEGHERKFGLRAKEVILTFDDGPIAGKTSRILDTLKKECVKATFFYVGRMARAYPRLVRRVVAEGHTLAHHTDAHNRLPAYSSAKVSALIDKGARTLEKIAYGEALKERRVPFFRYPYLAQSARTDAIVKRKGLVAFGANIDSLDWKRVNAQSVHNRIMRRLRQEGKGIILMHDIQGRTAKMLPGLLRTLKKEGYRVVHMVPPRGGQPAPDPVVVASVDTTPAKPANGQVVDKARPPKEPVKAAKPALRKQDDLIAIAEAEVAKAAEARRKAASLQTTSDVTTVTAATVPARALSPNIKPKPVKRSSIEVAALAPASEPKTTKVKALKKKKTTRVKVVAGSTTKARKRKTTRRKTAQGKAKAKNLIVARGWKLRRSQWIIR